MNKIDICEAKTSHVESLQTILARSFFPVNETVKKALPDNEEMRKWWGKVYSEEVDNPACHPIIAVDAANSKVVGVVCLRRIDAPGEVGGFWTRHGWTESHSEAVWRPSIDCMVAYEKKVMQGKPYCLLEIMAVDHEYKSQGIGRRLVQQACAVADKSRLPIFLQSHSAKGFYLGLGMGFRIESEPEWAGHKVCIIIRPASGVDVGK